MHINSLIFRYIVFAFEIFPGQSVEKSGHPNTNLKESNIDLKQTRARTI